MTQCRSVDTLRKETKMAEQSTISDEVTLALLGAKSRVVLNTHSQLLSTVSFSQFLPPYINICKLVLSSLPSLLQLVQLPRHFGFWVFTAHVAFSPFRGTRNAQNVTTRRTTRGASKSTRGHT